MKTLILPIGLVVLALLLTVLAIYFERTWRNYLQKRAEDKKTKAKKNVTFNLDETFSNLKDNLPDLKDRFSNLRGDMAAVTDNIPNLSSKVQNILRREEKPDLLIEPFRQWVRTELSHEPELRTWLLELPEFGFELLTSHIAEFCDEMNMDLTWLVERHMDVAAELKEATQAAIIDYCYACKKAVAVQGEAHIFAHYYNLTMNPDDQSGSELQRNLFSELTERGLATTPTPSQLIHASPKETREQAVHSIQEAAAKDWPQFADILRKTVMSDGNHRPKASVPNTSSSNGRKADHSNQDSLRSDVKKESEKDGTRINEIPIRKGGTTP